MTAIDRIFSLLDDWRQLPCYQLERRADIFFAPFLPDFLEHSLHIRINPTLIPEFPLRKEKNNRSCKADYLALAADGSEAFLIELKTDNSSRREGQDEYLKDAMKTGLQKLVQDVLTVARASLAKRKYAHLLTRMHALGLIHIPTTELPQEGELPSPRICQCAEIQATCGTPRMQIVYLQPASTTKQADDDSMHVLTFDQLAEFLSRYEDPVARRFRESLRAWARPCGTR